MCACDSDFTCARCMDTPADPRYLEDEYEPMREVHEAVDALVESLGRAIVQALRAA